MQKVKIRKPYIQEVQLPAKMTEKVFRKFRKRGAGFKNSPTPNFILKMYETKYE